MWQIALVIIIFFFFFIKPSSKSNHQNIEDNNYEELDEIEEWAIINDEEIEEV